MHKLLFLLRSATALESVAVDAAISEEAAGYRYGLQMKEASGSTIWLLATFERMTAVQRHLRRVRGQLEGRRTAKMGLFFRENLDEMTDRIDDDMSTLADFTRLMTSAPTCPAELSRQLSSTKLRWPPESPVPAGDKGRLQILDLADEYENQSRGGAIRKDLFSGQEDHRRLHDRVVAEVNRRRREDRLISCANWTSS